MKTTWLVASMAILLGCATGVDKPMEGKQVLIYTDRGEWMYAGEEFQSPVYEHFYGDEQWLTVRRKNVLTRIDLPYSVRILK